MWKCSQMLGIKLTLVWVGLIVCGSCWLVDRWFVWDYCWSEDKRQARCWWLIVDYRWGRGKSKYCSHVRSICPFSGKITCFPWFINVDTCLFLVLCLNCFTITIAKVRITRQSSQSPIPFAPTRGKRRLPQSSQSRLVIIKHKRRRLPAAMGGCRSWAALLILGWQSIIMVDFSYLINHCIIYFSNCVKNLLSR